MADDIADSGSATLIATAHLRRPERLRRVMQFATSLATRPAVVGMGWPPPFTKLRSRGPLVDSYWRGILRTLSARGVRNA